MMAMAPWAIRLLYTASFAPAVEVLRWQVLGYVLRVASWPLGFVILAAGDGTTFFWSESASWFVMAAFILILAPVMLLGCLVAAGFGVFGVGRISHMSDLGGPAGRIGAIARRITGSLK
jgi:PST family polysaccharide transporter